MPARKVPSSNRRQPHGIRHMADFTCLDQKFLVLYKSYGIFAFFKKIMGASLFQPLYPICHKPCMACVFSNVFSFLPLWSYCHCPGPSFCSSHASVYHIASRSLPPAWPPPTYSLQCCPRGIVTKCHSNCDTPCLGTFIVSFCFSEV